MDGTPDVRRTTRPSRTVLYGWGIYLLVLAVATWLLGPGAFIALAMAAGVALIVSGVRSRGWPRPVLIVVGALLVVLTPVVIFILDIMFGQWVVTFR